MNQRNGTSGAHASPEVAVDLRVAPERRLIRPSGSWRHIVFTVQTGALPGARVPRPPLALALVLDRSGSMSGGKLSTAKRAALKVLDHLSPADRVAVVLFDNVIDVLQPAEPATPALKDEVAALLSRVEPRGSTALHEGWLSGCREIASDRTDSAADVLARCFLLTDGLANLGLTDPELIATEAAAVRAHAGVSTSTFGIGADYDEGLLGPLAVAGGGQFHHLREVHEIGATFVGELRDLLQVAARDVRLELEVMPGTLLDLVSPYWAGEAAPRVTHWTIPVGDLQQDESRPLVARFWFPPGLPAERRGVRARLHWRTSHGEHATDWQSVQFEVASDRACDAEPRDAAVLHWVGLHHADRAEREAARLSRAGDVTAARQLLATVRTRIAAYAGADRELQEAVNSLNVKERQLAERRVDPMEAKEWCYASLRCSRSQKDYRDDSW